MGKQKILSSKTVFKSKLFHVTEDVVEAKDKKYHFSTVHAGSTAAVIPITSKGEIYLISEYRYLFGQYILGVIAGVIEEGETSLQAAKRELKEEGGMEAGQWELIAKLVPMRNIVKNEVYVFLAKDLEITKQNLQDEEEIEIVKITIQEAVKKIMNGEIFHSPSVAGILLLDKLKQQKRL